MTLTKTTSNAEQDPQIDGYLSAFGLLVSDQYAMPLAFKPEFEGNWNAWVLRYKTVGSGKLFLILRAVAFAAHLKLKGHTNVYVKAKPVRVGGGAALNLTPKAVCDTLMLSALTSAAFQIATFLRTTDLLAALRPTKTSTTVTKTHLITTICLERSRTADSLDQLISRLRGVLRFSTVPAQLKEVFQKLPPAAAKSKKPRVVTQGASILMQQFVAFSNWLPVVKSPQYDIWIVRAKDEKLVLKVAVPLNAKLIELTSKAGISKLWLSAFKKIK